MSSLGVVPVPLLGQKAVLIAFTHSTSGRGATQDEARRIRNDWLSDRHDVDNRSRRDTGSRRGRRGEGRDGVIPSFPAGIKE